MRSITVALLASAVTLLVAWAVMTWIDAGAPSPLELGRNQPGWLAGLSLPATGLLWLATLLRRRRKGKSG